jgi:hypothetical protein
MAMKSFLPVSSLRKILPLLLLVLPATSVAQGTVVAWGLGTQGETSVPVGLANVVDVDVGQSHVLALKANGRLVAWGGNENGQATAPSGVDFVAVSAGYFHNVALRANGTVFAWGDDSFGQSTMPEGVTDVVAVAAGAYHTLLLRADGTVTVVGGNPVMETDQVPAGLDNVVAIAANFYQSMALTADGKVHAWGLNLFGEATVPADLDDVVAIDAGFNFSLALKSDGTVVVLGDEDNYWGVRSVPAGLTDAVAIAAGTSHALAIRADGTVTAWGDACIACPDHGATAVPAGLADVTDIGAGHSFGVAVQGLPTEPQPLTHTYIGTITSGDGPQAGLLPVGSTVIVSPTVNAVEPDVEADPEHGEYEEGVISLKVEVPTADVSVTTGTGFLIVGNDYGFQDEADAVQYYGSNDISGTLGGFPVQFVALVFYEAAEAGAPSPTMIDSDAIPTTPIQSDSVSLALVANTEYNWFEVDLTPAPTVSEALEDAAARIRELIASDRLPEGVGRSMLQRLAAVQTAYDTRDTAACGLLTGLRQQVAHLPRRTPDAIAVGEELDALLLVLGTALGGCSA